MSRNKLITCAIAAEKLGFSRDYVRRMCLLGKIKAEKLGNDWIFPLSAIKHIRRQRRLREKSDGIDE